MVAAASLPGFHINAAVCCCGRWGSPCHLCCNVTAMQWQALLRIFADAQQQQAMHCRPAQPQQPSLLQVHVCCAWPLHHLKLVWYMPCFVM